jgi:protein KTI12
MLSPREISILRIREHCRCVLSNWNAFGTQLNKKTLIVQVAKAPSDALHVLEQTTSSIVSAIVSASSSQPTGGLAIVPISDLKLSISLPPRILTLSEMQRVKRQFVTIHKKAITLGTTERGAVGFDENNVGRKFAEYVAEHVH